MKKISLNSLKETGQFARDFTKEIKDGAIVALTGELGAGKTTLTQIIAKQLGINDKVISPTFVLIKEYPLLNGSNLYHLDLYRLEGEISIHELGITELLTPSKDIVLIEWAEKIEKHLPNKTIKINIQKIGDNKRILTIS